MKVYRVIARCHTSPGWHGTEGFGKRDVFQYKRSSSEVVTSWVWDEWLCRRIGNSTFQPTVLFVPPPASFWQSFIQSNLLYHQLPKSEFSKLVLTKETAICTEILRWYLFYLLHLFFIYVKIHEFSYNKMILYTIDFNDRNYLRKSVPRF